MTKPSKSLLITARIFFLLALLFVVIVSRANTDTFAVSASVSPHVPYLNIMAVTATPEASGPLLDGPIIDSAEPFTGKLFLPFVANNANFPPVLANIEGAGLSFTENDPTTVITSAITVSDQNSALLSSATVSISAGYQSGVDMLAFTNQLGITGSYNSGTGVLTLLGAATPANYQMALRSVTYVNTSENPAAGARTIAYIVNDGVVDSNTQSRQVTVTAVNDGPVNTVPAGQAVNEDTDLVFSAANSNAISVIDVDAASGLVKVSLDVAHGTLTLAQTSGLSFVDGTSDGQSSVHLTGTIADINAALNGLKYKGTLNFNSTRGAELLTVLTNDQGHTGAGGALSDSDTVTIGVNAVNDPPVALDKSFQAQANMKISLSGLLGGATDPDTGDGGYTATLIVGTVSATTPAGGTISSLNNATGSFDFDPAPGATGNITFTYTVCDSGSPAPAACSLPATVTVNAAGPVIWFVNPAAGTGGNGRLSSPFNNLASVDAVDAANQRIFLYTGTSPNGITLSAGEWLIGQGVTGASFDVLFGITPPAGTIARPSINGTRPVVSGNVVMAASDAVRGLNIQPASGTVGLSATTASGLTVAEVSVTTTNAAAVNLVNSDGTFSFTAISANGGTNGIVWTNTSAATGSFTVIGSGSAGSGGTIQNTTSHGIVLTNARSVTLDRMVIQNIGRNGIDGNGVVNFSFTNGTISSTGSALAGEKEENGIAFNDGLNFTESNVSGGVAITGSTITGARRNAIYIYNYSGTISSLNISNNSLSGGTTTATIADAIKVISGGSASTSAHLTTATIQNNTITGFRFFDGASSKYIGGSGIFISGGSGTLNNATPSTFGTQANPILISGNLITNMGSNAIAASFNGVAGTGFINVTNNGTQGSPINNVEGLGISVLFAGGNSFVGASTIDNNWIDTNGPTVRAGSAGLAVQLESIDSVLGNNTPQASFNITNNRVLHPDGNGIRVLIRNSNATGKVKVQNNTIGVPFGANRNGIRVDGGSAVGNTTLCLNLSGNTSAGSGVNQGIGLRKQGTLSNVNAFGINGLAPSPATGAQTTSYVASQNPSGSGVDIISGDNFVNCSLP